MENESRTTEMKDLLKIENVRFIHSVNDWQEAIRVSVAPLVEQGYCEERYIQGVIDNTYKYGPYYVFCENLALIHAEADKGIRQTQMAITVLKEPIKFKADGYDVRILIALGAKDSQSHLYAMQAISHIFTHEEKVAALLNASSADVIYEEFIASSHL